METSMLSTRVATIDDVPLLKKLIHELAEYEREPHAVLITEEKLMQDGFGPEPKLPSRMDSRLGMRSFLGLIPLGQVPVYSSRTFSCERRFGVTASGERS
jgi:hypothetical protein